MKHIILSIVLSSILLADFKYENLNELEFENRSGSVDTELTKSKGQGKKFGKVVETTVNDSKIKLTTSNDFYWDKFSINTSMFYMKYDDTYEHTRNRVIEGEEYIEIDDMRLNTYIDDYTITAGLLSFKNGAFKEYTDIGVQKSDSLFTMFNMTTQGIFITKRFDTDHRLEIGYTSKGMFKHIEDTKYNDATDGSIMDFIFYTNTVGKHRYTFNYTYTDTNIEVNNPYTGESKTDNIGLAQMMGLGYAYDDRTNSGNLYYSILAYSKTEWDSSTVSPIGIPFESNEYYFKGSDRTGKSLLLGYKKEFDFMKRDTFIGCEYFYADKYWTSFVSGEPHSDYSFGRMGNTYKLYTGINIMSNLQVKAELLDSQIDYSKKYVSNEVYDTDKHDRTLAIKVKYIF